MGGATRGAEGSPQRPRGLWPQPFVWLSRRFRAMKLVFRFLSRLGLPSCLSGDFRAWPALRGNSRMRADALVA